MYLTYKKLVEENSTCKFMAYQQTEKILYLFLECECGKNFKVSIGHFKNSNKKRCNVCGMSKGGLKNRIQYNIKELENLYEKSTKYPVKIIELKRENVNENNTRVFVYFKYLLKGVEKEIFKTRIDRFKKGNSQIIKDKNGVYHKKLNKTKTHKSFLKDLEKFRPNEFDILSEYKKAHSKVKVKRKDCGHIFETTPVSLTSSKRVECPLCISSKLEMKIKKELDKYDIIYKPQYKFKDCKNIRALPFDFAIFENRKIKFLIEADGKQHTQIVEHFGGLQGYLKRRKNDLIKNKYCRDNKIKLIRISYIDKKYIKNIIKYLIKI